ncbi:MAG TPA: hypothetical protein VE988_28870 [Gemmataceae bacterium]|nr:hypothetical protein [Gemmataceae bacterium]
MLRVTCKCGKTLGIGDEFAGKQVRCPACLTVLQVSGDAAPAPPAPPKPAPAPAPNVIRLTCKCGKSLGVGPVFAGKQVRCPACQTMLNVPPTSTPPVPAPPPAIQASAPATLVQIAIAKPVAAAPGKPKKSPLLLYAILAGGGVAALLFVGVVAWAAWFFLGGDSNTTVAISANKDTSTNASPPTNKEPEIKPPPKQEKPPETIAIKMFVPFKKGDRREVKIVTESKEDMKIEDPEKLPPDLQGAATKGPTRTTTTLHGIIRTLEVNDQGGETKIELTIRHFETQKEGDFQVSPDNPPNPIGQVLIGTLDGNRIKWSNPKGGPLPVTGKILDFVLGGSMDIPDTQTDPILGTPEKQPVGGVWKINADLLRKHFQHMKGGFPSPEKDKEIEFETNGDGKLSSITTEDGKDYLDVDIAINIAFKEGAMAVTARDTVNMRLPRDAATGPVKRIENLEFHANGEVNVGVMVMMKQKMTLSATVLTTYLGNTPVVDAPK